MPEFFLELFSEEIPARMQEGAAQAMRGAIASAFAPLGQPEVTAFYGPRRLAFTAEVAAATAEKFLEIRGPKQAAPAAALEGFCRKQEVEPEALVLEDGYYWLRQEIPPEPAADFIVAALENVFKTHFWPKSMRWAGGDDFAWVRPLRRIICLLDGLVVPFALGPVRAGNKTEGHRLHAPGAFTVFGARDWREKLRARFVLADAAERRRVIAEGLALAAEGRGLHLAADEALLDEVAGLVEWPVPLAGKIGPEFMDLPPEVRELSMRINQKYFALRDAQGKPAPYFAFVANLDAPDGGAAIIAGNERVLRARLADARHFWDLDAKTPLDALLPKLETITFHAKIGTQLARAERIAALAHRIALALGADAQTAGQAEIAGRLAKADLVTGMVGEFPELQGVMGGYYAARTQGAAVGAAIATHYQPRGPGDEVPRGVVAASVALADKLDMLLEFFRIGEKPTGSGDPYALRRAALGVIRIILENEFRLPLRPLLEGDEGLFGFIIERLRVKLRTEGKRHDILDAVLASAADDDLVRLMKRVDALGSMLDTEDGQNLHAAYKRAANILKIENAKDGPHLGEADASSFSLEEEWELFNALGATISSVLLGSDEYDAHFRKEDYTGAMRALALLRGAIDKFFLNVTVNAEQPEIRRNRLLLLAGFRDTVNQIADFSKLEG